MSYDMKCTVCDSCCSEKHEWLDHLTLPRHQEAARLQLRKWDAKTRACVLIVYSNHSFLNASLKRVVEVFSCFKGNIVTDFVWFPERPRICFVQFESRNAVDNFLKRKDYPPAKLKDLEIKLEKQKIQLRRAQDYMDFEWNELFVNVRCYPTKKDGHSTSKTCLVTSTTKTQERLSSEGRNRERETVTKSGNGIVVSKSPKAGDGQRNDNAKETPTSKAPALSLIDLTLDDDPEPPRNGDTRSVSVWPDPLHSGVPPPRREALQNVPTKSNLQENKTDNQKEKIFRFTFPRGQQSKGEPGSSNIAKGSTSNPANANKKKKKKNKNKQNQVNSPIKKARLAAMQQPSEMVGQNPKVSEAQIQISTVMPNRKSTTGENPMSTVVPNSSFAGSRLPYPWSEGVRNKIRDPRLRPIKIPVVVPQPQPLPLLPLSDQIKMIHAEVEIPDSEFNNNITILFTNLKTVFVPTFPKLKIFLFRNFYNGIRTNGSRDVILYLDHGGIRVNPLTQRQELMYASDAILALTDAELLNTIPGQTLFPMLKPVDEVEKALWGLEKHAKTYKLPLPTTNLYFSIVAEKSFMIERQACEMMRYLLSFDPRARALLLLVMYWAKVNNIRLANSMYKGYDIAPEPAALEWLVIFFLNQKKILPTARHIRIHQPVKSKEDEIIVSYNKDVTDISFDSDPKIALQCWTASSEANKWKDEEAYHVCVLKLAVEFFEFCLTLKQSPCILNTRDGVLIFTKDITDTSRSINKTMIETCLSRAEIDFLRQPIYQNCHLQLLYPICPLRYSFSFNEKTFLGQTCEIMTWCTRKLKVFLGEYVQNPSESWRYDLKSILKYNG